MNFQFYLEKLQESDDFKEFIKENSEAYLCSGFFTIDKKGNDNKQHFDFYVPNLKKAFSFQFSNELKKVFLEVPYPSPPEKISLECDFDFSYVEDMINERMEKEKIKNEVQKILLSLQCLNGKEILIGTVFISMMGLIKVNIDVRKNEIELFEKKSIFDMMRVVKRGN